MTGIRKYRLGKFKTIIDSLLLDAEVVQDEVGDVSDFGWFGIVRGGVIDAIQKAAEAAGEAPLTPEEVAFLKSQQGAILNEDNSGFVTVEWFDDIGELNRTWKRISKDAEKFYGGGSSGPDENPASYPRAEDMAGARCPQCKTVDSASWDNNARGWVCMSCGFSEEESNESNPMDPIPMAPPRRKMPIPRKGGRKRRGP